MIRLIGNYSINHIFVLINKKSKYIFIFALNKFNNKKALLFIEKLSSTVRQPAKKE